MFRRMLPVMGMGFLAALLQTSIGAAYEAKAVPSELRVAHSATAGGPTASGLAKARNTKTPPQAGGSVIARLDQSADPPARTDFRPTKPSQPDTVSEGSMPPALQYILAKSFPQSSSAAVLGAIRTAAAPAASEQGLGGSSRLQTLLTPNDAGEAEGSSPSGPDGAFRHLEIEVSHSEHEFKLIQDSASGQKEILYECKVGLGNPHEFPTPVGVYYVTHIYDDNPWWIPPANRAWAWGQSPSKKVYGGIMAPLLKKRMLSTKKKAGDSEDFISELVKLEDYGYRFHGTNAPRSIGRNESHGCVRMLPADVQKVAALIKENVGTVERLESENGTYVILRAPVRLNLIK